MHLNSVLKGMDKQVQDRDPHLKLIRVGQNDPQTVRLVFEVKQAMSPQVLELTPVAEFKNRLVLDFYPKNGAATEDDPLLALLEDYNRGDLEESLPRETPKPVKPVRTGRLLL